MNNNYEGTVYKRLTIRDEFGNADIIGVDSELLYQQLTFNEANAVTKAFNRLAKLEDKIEQGKMLELPCKVGDRIWVILGNNIFGRKVKSIVIRGNGYAIKTSNTNGWKELEPHDKEEFGVIWFLTKAKAEKKLKELKGND